MAVLDRQDQRAGSLCRTLAVGLSRLHRLVHAGTRLEALVRLFDSRPLAAPALLRAEKVEQLSPRGYVNDFAGVIDYATQQKLTALCQELGSRAP